MQKILPVLLLALIFSVSLINSFAEETNVQKQKDVYPVRSNPDSYRDAARSDVTSEGRTSNGVKVLYREGIVLYKNGKIEEAKEKFKTILDINPLYGPARSKLNVILDEQERMLRRDRINMEADKILEAEKKWEPPSKKPISEKERPSVVRFKTEQQRIMEEKAQQIVPEINFTDAHLRDVLQYLSRVSGINIILDEDIFVERGAGELSIPTEVEVTEEEPEISVQQPVSPRQGVISDRVTITLKNIPLIEALKYILIAKGLKYRIDEYAIIVSTAQRLEQVEMETRYYHLVSGIGGFTEYIEPAAAASVEESFEWEEETGEKKETTLTIKDVLEESGVPFPSGSKIFLDQRTGTLIIRNTPSNLAVIEDILRILDVTPYQIEIEARFVQIVAETAKELGLEWMIKSGDFRFGNDNSFRWDSKTTDPIFGRYPDPNDYTGMEGVTRGLRYLEERDTGSDRELADILEISSGTARNPIGNILSISGVLTVPEFRMILHALNQSGDANLVSAPKVTTLNNQRAKIEMITEFKYPGEFEVTPPTVNLLSEGTTTETMYSEKYKSFVVTPGIAVPVNFETRDVGIILNVTPSVGADRKTITLILIPKIDEFIGWIDYGVEEGAGWNKVPILKPIFQTRKVTTSVVINDGETVVLGGLVKEELDKSEDKIPLLGDIPFLGVMFRSKKEVSKKINLVIFVTAKLITPSGELVKAAKEYAY